MYKQLLIFSLAILSFTMAAAQHLSLRKVKKQIEPLLAAQPGVFALAFKDLQTGKSLYINKHTIFHAASTMKTPVLVEAYRQAAVGKFQLSDSIPIVNSFKSIADSSYFSLSPADDSELELYKHIGEKATVHDLLYQMIIYSSNLATNIIIEKLGAINVTATVSSMGATDIQVLRGVEDSKAFQLGLNNVVSAFGLGLIFEKMATGKIVNATACQDMITILLDQKFNDIIPAKLPAAVKVAHKTGFITGIHHDSGIVFLPDGRKYVLVLLSKNLTDEKAGIDAMATASSVLYNYMIQQ